MTDRVVVVQIPAGYVDIFTALVIDLYPVGSISVGFDFIDDHFRSIPAVGSTGRFRHQGKASGAVRIAAVGGGCIIAVIGSVFGPAVAVSELSLGIVKTDRVTGTNADGLIKISFYILSGLIIKNQALGVGFHQVQSSRLKSSSVCDLEAMVIGIVADLPAGKVGGAVTGIDDFDPVIGGRVDFIDEEGSAASRL